MKLLMMTPRRRTKTSRCALVRVVLSCCLLISVLSFYTSWMQLVVFRATIDSATQVHLRELTVLEQLCTSDSQDDGPSFSATTSTTMSSYNNINNNNNASFSLFFPTCSINADSLVRRTHRLAVNFTCPSFTTEEFLSADKNTESGRREKAQHPSKGTARPEHLESSRTNGSGSGSSSNNSSRSEDLYVKLNVTCKGRLIVSSRSPAFAVPFKDPCLKRYLEQQCRSNDNLAVPSIVHYVWFSPHPMDVVTLLSVLAAYRFLQPCLILFHSDSVPQGPHWAELLALVPVLVRVQRAAPETVFGRKLGVVQHKSDIARLELLREYGGIYLDGDQVVLRSLDEFRNYQFVMGHENANNLANSLLISVPNAKFIDVWYRNYRSYNPKQWGIHSTFLPLALARIFPTMIHNAGFAFIKPDLPGVLDIWQGHYDWSGNHAVHLYFRSMVEWKVARTNYTLAELTRLNSSLGQIARHVVFGNKDACTGGALGSSSPPSSPS